MSAPSSLLPNLIFWECLAPSSLAAEKDGLAEKAGRQVATLKNLRNWASGGGFFC